MMSHHQQPASNRSYTNHLQPNVIARLMGIDDDDAIVPTPPPPPASATIIQATPRSTPFNRANCSLLPYPYCSSSSNGHSDSPSSSRLLLHKKMMTIPRSIRSRRRRRHPQEDLLQKIRQDFQAWQASRAPVAAPVATPLDGRRLVQVVAQEDLRREKMARYGFGFPLGHSSGGGKVMTHDEHSPMMMMMKREKKKNVVRQNEPSSEHAADSNKVAAAEPAGLLPSDRVTITTPVIPTCAAGASAEKLFREDLEVLCEDGRHDRNTSAQELKLPSQSHTPIVLLKPSTTSEDTGAAIGAQNQKTFFFGLPKVDRDASMNVFLQEVKDRVQKELRVLTAATTTASELKTTATWGIQPNQIAGDNTANKQQIVFTKDRGNKRLFRSESFRAFRRDRRRNGTPAITTPPTHASPEARILSREAVSPENDDEESIASRSITSRERARSSLTCASLSVPGAGVTEGQSFRSECLTKHKEEDQDVVPSPRVLFRSFSAPDSGFSLSLGRLFVFGDGNGSVKSTKIGASEEGTDAAVASKNVDTSFSFIRGTVSRLRRHSSSLRRNLFRRKTMNWSKKMSLGVGEIHPKMEMPVCTTSPSHETFNLFKVAQANLSELPPSPVSPLEVAGHSSRHFFTDLHCTLPAELSPKCLSEAPASELSYRTDITLETVCSRDKAYIREVLIAAGLYEDGSLDNNNKANARVDSMARPICDDVFEDVEDMYYYRGEYVVGMYDETGGVTTDHRMLFDLANEALQSLVESSKAGSSLRQWVVGSTGVSRGKKLLDDVWQQVQTLRNPQMQEMQTIESMVAFEVRRCVWAEVLFEDVYAVGRKIERAIFDELIEDLFAGGFHMIKPS